MMLDFWYSDRCHRQIKLALCVAVCLMIYYCAKVAELSLTFSLISLGLGVLIHVLRAFKLKLQAQERYNSALDTLFFLLPILYWFGLMMVLPKMHVCALMLQAIGFSVLGLFVVSIYSQRARRFT